MCHIAKLRNIFYNNPIYMRKRTSCYLYCMCNHIKTPRISARRPQRGVEIVVYGGYLIGAIFFGVWTTSNCLARKSNPFCVTRILMTVNDSWLLRSINFSFNSK